MSIIIGGKTIVGPGNSPYVGENGHWFVGHDDTGVEASTNIFYRTSEEFKTSYEEGVYYVYDEETAELKIWHITESGKKSPVVSGQILVPTRGENNNWFLGDVDLGIPWNDPSTVTGGGATIDDESISDSTAWSSYKTNKEIEKAKRDGIPGVGLEFNWRGTQLGVRREGVEEYSYRDLGGSVGLAGLDGSSIFDAELLPNGHLVLTVQDCDDIRETHEILSVPDTFTKDTLKEIYNSINRLNREIYIIKKSQVREIVPVRETTGGEFILVHKYNGTGNLQVIVNKFVGTIRITVDGAMYTVKSTSTVGMPESSLLTITDKNQMVMMGLFNGDVGRGLDIPFGTSLLIEVMVPVGTPIEEFPKLLIQGTCYFATSDNPDASGDYIPVETMTKTDVDNMMGLI